MIRGFKEVSEEFKAIPEVETKLPLHGSKHSAGFDFYSKEKVLLVPGAKHKFITDIKAYMEKDEYLALVVRSSIGMKKGLRLTNQYAVIDADYYENQDTGGNICAELKNESSENVYIEIDERIVQGIFQKKLFADEGSYNIPEKYIRTGGIGSSDEK